MKTIALRFAENFAPREGTIAAHSALMQDLGYVWYGKLGSPVSAAVSEAILKQADPRILLIHSGKSERYWLHVDAIQRDIPELEAIPLYYRNNVGGFGCWFRVVAIETASKDVMSKCIVSSSRKSLSLASRHSMSPYFIIEYASD